jgi:polyribonucleotide nucleotidyltransferase
MKTHTYTLEFGGKSIVAEFNDLTNQADGSVLMRAGETAVLVTAVMGHKEQPDLPYFPLSVEFEEKFYAVGAILGSRYQRREGRPSDEAILSARIVDRTIRPLFPSNLRRDVQVVVSVLAIGDEDPDILAVIGTSLALGVSHIPWNGPVGAVRIARRKDSGELLINPTYSERLLGDFSFEVLACGKAGTINMIETAACEVAEGDIVAVLDAATQLHSDIERISRDIILERGQTKISIAPREIPESLSTLFASEFASKLGETLFRGQGGKTHLYGLKEEWLDTVATKLDNVRPVIAADFFEDMVNEAIHVGAIEFGKRTDGRGLDEVRPLHAQAGGISPVLHGCGIFYRGDTHVMTALTLGGPEAAQILDTVEDRETSKRFMHHYNFPPFSVGETGRVGGFNRRMIGHGALAEKALFPVIPDQEKFPYTIRLVSETLSSNGSSSMASVCASTLALMDGGVPIVKPVAGIASGVMMSGDQYVLLTDIQGPEDEHGDMDFKVAGTCDGITAIQMDVKVDGVPVSVLAEALEKARLARLTILDTITAALAAPRPQISNRAPQIETLMIKPEQIGLVIGSGGKTINKIKEETGVGEISIEDSGRIYITGHGDTVHKAKAAIQSLTKEYVIGEQASVTITKIATFGAFAKLDEHHEGLIHISEIVPFRLSTMDGVLKEGEVVPVEVVKIEDGKIGLSIKKVNPNFASERGIEPPATT